MTEDRRGKPRGRPKAPPSSSVSVWVQTSLHDALIKRARDRDQSVSKTVRDLLVSQLEKSTMRR